MEKTSSSCRKTGCWVNQKKNRESPTFGRVPKCNECFPGMNKRTENPRTCVWSHNRTHEECGESLDCDWGTAPADVLVITVTEAATCRRCAAKPCKQPAPWVHVFPNTILLWMKKRETERSISSHRRHKRHTIVCFISKLCEVLRGNMKEDQVC